MSASMKNSTIACRCGQVRFDVTGEPIVTATCHCTSCQRAGADFATLPGQPTVLNADAGTEYALLRKDRVACVQGEALLRAHRLAPQAPTRRVLASCCDSPMFLEFRNGHWLSLYRDRYGADAPPIEMRLWTRNRPEGVTFSDGLPTYKTMSAKFMWRLLAAWAAMGFRAPAISPSEATS